MKTMEPLAANPKHDLFFLPPELRYQVYWYLLPDRIHISPPSDVQWEIECRNDRNRIINGLDGLIPDIWALILVSRQFRSEIRSIAYPHTNIEIHLASEHLNNSEEKLAYEAWIGGLKNCTGICIPHLSLDEFVDIHWNPAPPASEHSGEKVVREEREEVMQKQEEYRDKQRGWGPDCERLIQDIDGWWVHWQKPNYNDEDEMERDQLVRDTLRSINAKRDKSGSAMVGLQVEDIRDLVGSFCTFVWRRNDGDSIVDPKVDRISEQGKEVEEGYDKIPRVSEEEQLDEETLSFWTNIERSIT
ncbi:MAG: hypothetical protein Q9209_001099 [Squamulea sp. 1 TL-2023]